MRRHWVVSRTDAQLDFDWGVGSPVPGVIPNDNFAVQWDGWVTFPTSGNYQFGGAN